MKILLFSCRRLKKSKITPTTSEWHYKTKRSATMKYLICFLALFVGCYSFALPTCNFPTSTKSETKYRGALWYSNSNEIEYPKGTCDYLHSNANPSVCNVLAIRVGARCFQSTSGKFSSVNGALWNTSSYDTTPCFACF